MGLNCRGLEFGPLCRCKRCVARRRRERDLRAPIWQPNSLPALARNRVVLDAIAELGR